MKTIEQTLQAMETEMRLPENRVPDVLSKLLAPEFVEFASSGRALTKSECLAAVQAQAPVSMTTSDFKVLMLADTVGLVTYRVTRHGEQPVQSIRSSLWQQRAGTWQLVFHQGTVVPAQSPF